MKTKFCDKIAIAVKSFLFFWAAFLTPAFAAAQTAPAEKPAETSEISKHEKELTPEELAHKEYQAQLDREAVKQAKSIRGLLKSLALSVKDINPSLSNFLITKFFGIRVIQYLASAAILILTFLIARFLLGFLLFKFKAFADNFGKDNFLSIFATQIKLPLGILVWVHGMYFALVFLMREDSSIAVMTRAIIIVIGFGFFWAIIIVSDVFFMATGKRMRKRSSSSTANLIDFLRRVVKSVIIIIALLSVLSNCGLNVNTIMASLGIGGMALAFASQDTIANFFGSVSIIVDRPFTVGDWVKTSACEGYVEVIGFRSTRIRTFRKTLVSIPNSILAKESIENCTKMPARKVVQTIGVTYSTTSEQMQKLMEDLREAIAKVDGVAEKEGVSVEFLEFADSSLNINIIYYTNDLSYAAFCAVRCDVNLKIMDIVEENGLSFAFPSTSLYIEKMGDAPAAAR